MTPEQIAAMQAENAQLKADALTAAAKFTALEVSSAADKEAADKRLAAIEAEQNASKVGQARAGFTAMLETEVTEKRITPAQREAFAAVLGIDDDERVLTLDDEKVKAMFTAPAATDGGEQGRGDGENHGDKSAGETLSEKAYDYMAKSGSKDFSAALQVVMRAEPELARDYINSNGEVQ